MKAGPATSEKTGAECNTGRLSRRNFVGGLLASAGAVTLTSRVDAGLTARALDLSTGFQEPVASEPLEHPTRGQVTHVNPLESFQMHASTQNSLYSRFAKVQRSGTASLIENDQGVVVGIRTAQHVSDRVLPYSDSSKVHVNIPSTGRSFYVNRSKVISDAANDYAVIGVDGHDPTEGYEVDAVNTERHKLDMLRPGKILFGIGNPIRESRDVTFFELSFIAHGVVKATELVLGQEVQRSLNSYVAVGNRNYNNQSTSHGASGMTLYIEVDGRLVSIGATLASFREFGTTYEDIKNMPTGFTPEYSQESLQSFRNLSGLGELVCEYVGIYGSPHLKLAENSGRLPVPTSSGIHVPSAPGLYVEPSGVVYDLAA